MILALVIECNLEARSSVKASFDISLINLASGTNSDEPSKIPSKTSSTKESHSKLHCKLKKKIKKIKLFYTYS